jgi:HSP20 family protein
MPDATERNLIRRRSPLRLAQHPFGRYMRAAAGGSTLGAGYQAFCPEDTWTPDVNLYETPTAYLVCVNLAGVEKDSIDLTVADRRLTLRGERPVPKPPTEDFPASDHSGRMRMHLMEIDYGSFNREVELPEGIDRQKITAAYRNGMLWVELPKQA